jgi:hypothetical protein
MTDTAASGGRPRAGARGTRVHGGRPPTMSTEHMAVDRLTFHDRRGGAPTQYVSPSEFGLWVESCDAAVSHVADANGTAGAAERAIEARQQHQRRRRIDAVDPEGVPGSAAIYGAGGSTVTHIAWARFESGNGDAQAAPEAGGKVAQNALCLDGVLRARDVLVDSGAEGVAPMRLGAQLERVDSALGGLAGQVTDMSAKLGAVATDSERWMRSDELVRRELSDMRQQLDVIKRSLEHVVSARYVHLYDEKELEALAEHGPPPGWHFVSRGASDDGWSTLSLCLGAASALDVAAREYDDKKEERGATDGEPARAAHDNGRIEELGGGGSGASLPTAQPKPVATAIIAAVPDAAAAQEPDIAADDKKEAPAQREVAPAPDGGNGAEAPIAVAGQHIAQPNGDIPVIIEGKDANEPVHVETSRHADSANAALDAGAALAPQTLVMNHAKSIAADGHGHANGLAVDIFAAAAAAIVAPPITETDRDPTGQHDAHQNGHQAPTATSDAASAANGVAAKQVGMPKSAAAAGGLAANGAGAGQRLPPVRPAVKDQRQRRLPTAGLAQSRVGGSRPLAQPGASAAAAVTNTPNVPPPTGSTPATADAPVATAAALASEAMRAKAERAASSSARRATAI